MDKIILYQTLKNRYVACCACSHRCKIADGNAGICGVRRNTKGEMILLVYGRAVAVNIDPIEKKPFYHFLPASMAYSIGTYGCNFHCQNCHNYSITQFSCQHGSKSDCREYDFGVDLPPEKAVCEAKSAGCASIAYTYNEPTIWAEYALEIMKLAKKEGLRNLWVSNGFMTDETLDAIFPYLDAINIDIKSFSPRFYIENCGARLSPVLENCVKVVKKGIHLEVTTLIIPGMSDDEKMLAELAYFIRRELGEDVPWHISAFSGAISWKLNNTEDTGLSKLGRAYKIGKKAGLNYVYVGNAETEGMENTYCPGCGLTVIERSGYSVENRLEDNKCRECGKRILAGIK